MAERLPDLRNSAPSIKGLSFARAAIAIALSKGDPQQALRTAENRYPYSGAVLAHIKSAVAAGTTSDATWASPDAYGDMAAAEFAEILRAGTITGKMAELRRVPTNVRYPSQTAAAATGWVSEGGATPMGRITLTTNTIGIAKACGIVALSKELLMVARLDAELLIRNELIKSVTNFLDAQFISPSVAAVANQNPASITYGLTATQSTGSTATLIAADLATLVTTLADANETDALYWIMTRSDAARLAAKRDTAGAAAFPDMTATGGKLLGIPVIASNNVPHSVSAGSIVVLVNAASIDYADADSIAISASENAMLEMSDSPSGSASGPTAATMVSMFQTNSIALKIVAFRNWARVRSTAVAYLDNVHW